MKIRPYKLWQLPVSLVVASILVRIIGTSRVLSWIYISEVNNTVSPNQAAYIILFAVLFAAVFVLIGLFLCREMSRWEILASASIYVAVQLILQLVLKFVSPLVIPLFTISYYGFAYNQCFIDALSAISGSAVVSLLGVFSTYLFVLFGKEQEEQAE